MSIFSDDSSNVEVTATFPPANPLGLIVNGEQNQLLLHFINSGTGNFTIVNAAASYHDPERNWALIRNTSALKYNVPLPAGSNFSVPFRVFSEFKPQPIGLTVWANLQDVSKDNHRFVAMNSTVDVVEPAGSWFDLQLIFLYLVITAVLGLAGTQLYKALMSRYFPQTTRTRRAKSGGAGKRAVVPAEKGKAYPESVQPYEEEWIPEGLRARTKKKGVVGEGATAPGASSAGEEATSGAEGASSGGERRKTKGKKGKKH